MRDSFHLLLPKWPVLPARHRRGSLEDSYGRKAEKQGAAKENRGLLASKRLNIIDNFAGSFGPHRVGDGVDMLGGLMDILGCLWNLAVEHIGRLMHQIGNMVQVTRP